MIRADLFGAVTAQLIYLLTIAIFVVRLLGRPAAGHWIGITLLATAVPLAYLLTTAPRLGRPTLYYIQIGLMLAYLLAEFLLDYALKIEFRQTRWMVICYVTLFFAGTGGMIGVASQAGRPWAISSVVLFLVMAALAFWQRAKTGM